MEVVILTKSSKNKGYCVAGIDLNNRQWVRLVSDDKESHGSLFNKDMRYEDNTYCKVLDSVRVPIIQKAPTAYQPENVLIDKTVFWKKIGRLSIHDVLKLHPAEKHIYLLGNEWPYITQEKVAAVGHSLVLIEVANVAIAHTESRKAKAKFQYGLKIYENMSVTDPDFYLSEQTIKHAVLVLSLPDIPHNEKYYNKFIAKIFPLED
jgi:hypothetical protein